MRTLHWQAEMKSLCGDFTRRAFERPLSMVLHVFSFLCTSTAFILLFLKMGALKETKWTYALIPTFVAWISVPSSIIVNYHDNQRISMIRSFLLKMGVRNRNSVFSVDSICLANLPFCFAGLLFPGFADRASTFVESRWDY